MTTTTNLALELFAENQLQLDTQLNENLSRVDAILAGASSYQFTSDADVTVTDQHETKYLLITDTSVFLTTARDFVMPDNFSPLFVKNSTAQTLTLKTDGGTGVAFAAGDTKLIYCDGDVAEFAGAGFESPMTTEGDLILAGSGGTAARLPIGTSGKVLESDGTTASWQTPASGFSNPMTTDGDLIVGGASGAPNRLSIGSTGQVPASNGSAIVWGEGVVTRRVVTAVTSSSGVVDFNFALGDYFTFALSEAVTSITFSNLPGSGYGATIMVRITQDSTARAVTWPASFDWAGGSAESVSTGSGDVDILAITTFDNGTAWHATLAKASA